MKSFLERSSYSFHCAPLNVNVFLGDVKAIFLKSPKAKLQEVGWIFWGGGELIFYTAKTF